MKKLEVLINIFRAIEQWSTGTLFYSQRFVLQLRRTPLAVFVRGWSYLFSNATATTLKTVSFGIV